MTIARRRYAALDAIAAPMSPAPTVHLPVPELGVPVPFGDAPGPESTTPSGRLRRCTFRRIDRTVVLPSDPAGMVYEVMCLYGGADEPLALGGISEARPICDTCPASGIFRPDED